MFPHGKQTITYWALGSGDDGFGKLNFAAPQTFKGRWEDKQEQTVDAQGREMISLANIFTDDDTILTVGGYLYLGSTKVSDPRGVVGANEIKNVSRMPDLRNLEAVRVAIL